MVEVNILTKEATHAKIVGQATFVLELLRVQIRQIWRQRVVLFAPLASIAPRVLIQPSPAQLALLMMKWAMGLPTSVIRALLAATETKLLQLAADNALVRRRRTWVRQLVAALA